MNETWIGKLRGHRATTPVALFLIVAIGSYFRLANLGLAAFRSDEGFFMDICTGNLTAGQIFSRWMELYAWVVQFPFVAAWTRWFVDFFHLAPTHFNARLPSALWGILAIFAAYGAGRTFAGQGLGLALAWFLAIQPYYIQISREAYYYSPVVCGGFFGLWTACWIFEHIHNRQPITPALYAVNAAGFFLLTYASPMGWMLALLVASIVVYAFVRDLWKTKRVRMGYAVLLLSYAIIGIPLLVCSWGLKQVIYSTSSELKAYWFSIFGSGDPFLPALWKAITAYGWGNTWLRGAFTAGMVLMAFAVFFKKIRKRDYRFLFVFALFAVAFVGNVYSMRSAGRPFYTRYVVVLLPLVLTFVVAGIFFSADLLQNLPSNLKRLFVWTPVVFGSIATLLWLPPAFLCTRLTGNPVPYKLINSWVDANLPRGTLILVDRWFEPWCEMRTEPSTNVIYTYTIPNEPLDVYLKYRWRDTATNFFAQNPDAAYLEISKSYWDNPEVGPWQWPRTYFAHHVAFTNEAGLRLRELGLASREDFYSGNTNRLIVELFYNTRQDVLNRTKNEGRPVMAFFGEGWGYWKNGPGWNQTPNPDYRDWRVLQDEAQIELYNLGNSRTNVDVLIRKRQVKHLWRNACGAGTVPL